MVSGESLADALVPSLDDVGPVPTSGPALVKFAGGRRALQEQMSGMSGPPAKRAYPDEAAWKAASIKWRSAGRQVQRWDEAGRAGKQRRGVNRAHLAPGQEKRVRSNAIDRKWSAIVRRGLYARMLCRMHVDSPKLASSSERVREIPSGGPGVKIPGDVVADILGRLEDEGEGPAAAHFQEAFFESYGGMPAEEAMVDEVWWLKIWPVGTPEPPA